MAERRQQESHEYTVKIIAVKLKIKFPCKMRLQYNNECITSEVAPNQSNKFVFNQDIVLEGNNVFEIMVNIYTEKGSKYVTGLLKLLPAELIRTEGERIVIPLTKCLDSDAFCELKVEQVTASRKSFVKQSAVVLNSVQKGQNDNQTPSIKRMNSQRYLIGGQTRSELNFNGIRINGREQEPNGNANNVNKIKQKGPQSQIFKTFTKSPQHKQFSMIRPVGNGNIFNSNNGNLFNNNLNNYRSQFNIQQQEVLSNGNRFTESQVYREGYQKLREKYKKESELAKNEAHKRLLLQSNENTYKLEIMRLKLKTEQQQKLITEKNEKIRSTSCLLIQLQKKELDANYLKEQNANYDSKIKYYENQLELGRKENELLKKLMKEKMGIQLERIKELGNEVESLKYKLEQNKVEYQMQIKSKSDLLANKSSQLKQKMDTIQRQKKTIMQLQKNSEDKLIQFQKSLSNQKHAYNIRCNEYKIKIETAERQKHALAEEIQKYKQQLDKHKQVMVALQYNKKVLMEQSNNISSQLAEMRAFKQKYMEISKQHNQLQQHFQSIKKSLQLALLSKDINLHQITSKYQQKIQRLQKSRKQLQDRNKGYLSRNNQLQASLQGYKSTQQKSKRSYQLLAKEYNDLKGYNNELKANYSQKQRLLLQLESDNSNNRSKYQKQEYNYKQLVEKYREEKYRLEKELDALKQGNDKLSQIKRQYQDRQAHNKIKERHQSQKYEKLSNNYKQQMGRHEVVVNELQSNIRQLNGMVDKLRQENNHSSKTIHEYQINNIKNKQINQRLKKENKLMEEKLLGVELLNKGLREQYSRLQQRYKAVQIRYNDSQAELNRVKHQLTLEVNHKAKQQKIVQIVNANNAKLHKQIEQINRANKLLQQQENRLREEIKTRQQELTKLNMKYLSVQKQYSKFKENMHQIIEIQFGKLVMSGNLTNINTANNKLRDSQISSSKSNNSHINANNKQTNHNNNNANNNGNHKEGNNKQMQKQQIQPVYITSLLSDRLKETKYNLSKILQLNRKLKQENALIQQSTESSTSKYEFEQIELQRDIQLLEDEMNQLIENKEEECINYDHLIIQLQFNLKEKDSIICELRSEIQELEAINRGIKTDFETHSEINDKKCGHYKLSIAELEKTIEYLNLNVACLEDKSHELEEQILSMESSLKQSSEELFKKEKHNAQLLQNKKSLEQQYSETKRQCKTMNERNIQLQLVLSTQKQTKEKYLQMLRQQETKTSRFNQLVNSLIANKQRAIKSQLQKEERISEMEMKNIELERKLELLAEQNEKSNRMVVQYKQKCKLLVNNQKSLEIRLNAQLAKSNKLQEKLKQRQKQIELKLVYLQQVEHKYKQLRDKNFKQIHQLSEEIEDKTNTHLSSSKQLNQKIYRVQLQNKRLYEQLNSIRRQLQQLTMKSYIDHQRAEQIQRQLQQMHVKQLQYREEIQMKDGDVNRKQAEIKEQEIHIYEYKERIYALEEQSRSMENNYANKVTELTSQYNYKIELSCAEYQDKLELLQRQLNEYKHKIKQKEEIIYKISLQRKNVQVQYENNKRTLEEKVRKIQTERMSSIVNKNNEIKKLSQQNKQSSQLIKQKQAQIRNKLIQIQQYKSINNRHALEINHIKDEHKNSIKILQKQIQVLKNNKQQNKLYKDKVITLLHSNQIQVRRVIKAMVKSILDNCDKVHVQKLSPITKGLQSNIINAMSINNRINE